MSKSEIKEITESKNFLKALEWRLERNLDIEPCKVCGGLPDKEYSQKIRNYICKDCYAV